MLLLLHVFHGLHQHQGKIVHRSERELLVFGSNRRTAVLQFRLGRLDVVLNLGTNDDCGFKLHDDGKGTEGVAGQTIIAEVKRFLGEIRSHNPRAKILWTWGMLALDIVPVLIEKGINEYKRETGDNAVYALELESLDALEKCDEDRGSRGHPGPLTHKRAAQKITGFLKSL